MNDDCVLKPSFNTPEPEAFGGAFVKPHQLFWTSWSLGPSGLLSSSALHVNLARGHLPLQTAFCSISQIPSYIS